VCWLLSLSKAVRLVLVLCYVSVESVTSVTVRFDCNTDSAAQEEEQSDCDSDEHSITSLGYHVQLDNGQNNENDFTHVYDN